MRLRLPSPNRSEGLEPMAVDMRALFIIGTLAWGVAGTVVTVLAVVGWLDATWVAVCAAGVIIGAGGWSWARWRGK
jgi:hypothetical protein